jgi:TRAP transporter 4TM/12TM fusion protein
MENKKKTAKLTAAFNTSSGVMCFALAAFVVFTAVFGVLTAVIQRSIVWGFTVVITLVNLAKRSIDKKDKITVMSVIYIILAIVAVVASVYICATFKLAVERAGQYTQMDIIISFLVFVLMIFAAQRSLGWPMVIIALAFLAYAMLGRYIPGSFGHRGYTIRRLMPYLSLGTEGIFGTSMGVASGVIVTYGVFGSVMEKFGLGDYFIKVAYGMVGRNKGGSAKASIIASALMGTVSGSAVANILTTGSFTLPLMTKSGYSKRTAAAILAVAATGGLIMPPVMGAAAFVMAEMRGISYGSICIAAAVPALLYYLCLFVESGLEADRVGMKVLTKDELPSKKEWLPQVYLFLPLAVLLVLLMIYRLPAQISACVAMGVILVLGLRKKNYWPTPRRLYESLTDGGSSVISTILTCATAGIIVGVLSMTGLSVKISGLITTLAGQSIWLALFLTMIVDLILGMGMPPVAAYIILASMIVPTLVQMGVPQIAADLFCFYFACIGNITPPVALASFTSAGLLQEDPFKTGFTAFRYAIITLLVPYAFCASTGLLLMGSPWEIISTTTTAVIGVTVSAIGVIGWWKGKVPMVFRGLLLVSAVVLIIPGTMTDIMGLVIAGASLFYLWTSHKKNQGVHAL